MAQVKVSTRPSTSPAPSVVADAVSADEIINAQVVVFDDTNPPQLAFKQTNQPANIRAFAGFETKLGFNYLINLEMTEDYTLLDPPVLWQQQDGTYTPDPPSGFEVFFDPAEPTKVSIVDDFRHEDQGGVFVFLLRAVDKHERVLRLDPTIVNRPISNIPS